MDIKLLIPQREPIIMVDKIISHSQDRTTTSFIIKDDNIFLEKNIFQSSGLIENIAQSAAARMGLQISKGTNKSPLIGYIASIKNMIIYRLPEVGEVILTGVRVTNQINNIIVIQGESKVNEMLTSTCELKVFIQE